jgi:sulfur carrier protein ThiS
LCGNPIGAQGAPGDKDASANGHRGPGVRAQKESLVVQVVFRDKSWEVKPGSTIRHIIEEANLNPESILALRDGKLVNDATLTKDGDAIKLVTVVSGG